MEGEAGTGSQAKVVDDNSVLQTACEGTLDLQGEKKRGVDGRRSGSVCVEIT